MENKEDTEIKKEVSNKHKKIISVLLTIITIIAFFWEYLGYAYVVAALFLIGEVYLLSSPIVTLIVWVMLIVFFIDVRAVYLYIKYILNSFENNKKVRSVILTIILLAVITLFRIQSKFMNDKFITITWSVLVIICATIVPIFVNITDIIKILRNKNSKKYIKAVKIIIITIIMIVTQYFMIKYSFILTKNLANGIQQSNIDEILKTKEKSEIKDDELINYHVSENEKNLNIIFEPSSRTREDWITKIDNGIKHQKGDSNYTFKNMINLSNTDNELSYMKIGFKLNSDLTNYIPIDEDTENYNKIDSYLIASSVMQITLKKDINIVNDYYTVRFNRYDEEYNVRTYYDYIFEPVAEVYKDSEGKQIIEIKYNKTYPLGELENIEIILGKE